MTREDVIELFSAWKNAGLRPPNAATSAQANAMIDAFHGQYKNVTAEELQALKSKLSHANYWPKFVDVDEVLAECRKGKNSNPSYTGGLYGKAKRDKECEVVLGRPLADGESWTMALAKKCAARLFVDADMEFIERNKLVLATQQELDYNCATCHGLSIKECPLGCHVPYLRVEPDTGLCVQYVDTDSCGKRA